jgi:hypothetical protein
MHRQFDFDIAGDSTEAGTAWPRTRCADAASRRASSCRCRKWARSLAPRCRGRASGNQPDVDRFGVQGAPAGVIDPVGAVTAHQRKQPDNLVNLAHLRPRQRMLQQRRRVGADMGTLRGCPVLQRIQVSHRVCVQLGRQAGGVDVPAPRGHRGMHLDQLAAPIQLHRAGVGTGGQPLPDQLTEHARRARGPPAHVL